MNTELRAVLENASKQKVALEKLERLRKEQKELDKKQDFLNKRIQEAYDEYKQFKAKES